MSSAAPRPVSSPTISRNRCRLSYPPRQPGAPGQFAFANGYRLRSILEESGWAGIDILLTDHPSAVHSPDAILIIGAKVSH